MMFSELTIGFDSRYFVALTASADGICVKTLSATGYGRCIVGWSSKMIAFVQKSAEIFGGVEEML